MHAVLSLRKIPRLSGFHHFYAFCHNNYSSNFIFIAGYQWKKNWD
ncbi:amino acid ABC transporter [Salmonella enterica subsp. enterica serovar Paratyphi A str. ATCC 11511]|nr:amino acid ABC transporter [Salmonella enterica subsp. enterica serovar Paratyphi A str. ATCC 11511]